jgi:transcriptional regulator with XRE-family HTH domain
MLQQIIIICHNKLNMVKKNEDLRKILAKNIRIQREIQGISQEKLAEITGISINMIKDIEGCRTWVSDKTLIKLASALKTDTFRLFMDSLSNNDEIYRTIALDLSKIIQKTKKVIDFDFEKALELLDSDKKEKPESNC